LPSHPAPTRTPDCPSRVDASQRERRGRTGPVLE
jgi:hypothetical protein